MFITKDGKWITMPWRADLAQLMPHAKMFVYQGASMLLIPNGSDEAKVCRNIGVALPPPILTRYDWCGQKPWEVQRTTAALLAESKRAYVLNEMGTGKTRAAIFAADYLMREGKVKRVLVAAPLSTLTCVWETEIFHVLPRATTVVLHGSAAKRRQLLAEGASFCIINHHGMKVLFNELLAANFDLLILDELAIFRNKSSDLWKRANALAAATKYVWGLTGSPTPTSPTDAWAQVRMLTPERVPRSVTAFRGMTMNQQSMFRWTPKAEANEIVWRAMQPAVRFARSDIMELPPTSYVNRTVKLHDKTKQAYDTLYTQLSAYAAQHHITAANEGVLQNKLLQVSLGYVYADNHATVALPAGDRMQALLDTVHETDRKVIVFVPYLHALDAVASFLRSNKLAVEVVSGATARGQRDRIFQAFQHEDEPRVLVAHPQTMAHGLTLTAADTIVWYGPPNSLEIYEQANARIARPSQTAKTLIVHLRGTAVERATYKRLMERSKMQGLLLDMFHKQEVTL